MVSEVTPRQAGSFRRCNRCFENTGCACAGTPSITCLRSALRTQWDMQWVNILRAAVHCESSGCAFLGADARVADVGFTRRIVTVQAAFAKAAITRAVRLHLPVYAALERLPQDR